MVLIDQTLGKAQFLARECVRKKYKGSLVDVLQRLTQKVNNALHRRVVN